MSPVPAPADARQAALQRLALSRAQLGVALRPAAAGRSVFSLRRLVRELGVAGWPGSAATLKQAGARLAPWARRHPLATVALGAAAGAGLYLARGWLLTSGLLQARRTWRIAKAVLLQQALNVALDPVVMQALLNAIPSAAAPGRAGEAASDGR